MDNLSASPPISVKGRGPELLELAKSTSPNERGAQEH